MPLAEMPGLGRAGLVSGDSLIYDRPYSIMDSTTRGVVERQVVSCSCCGI
jgi:hypothetical protein